MSTNYVSLSAEFKPGAGNIKEALEIYEEMKERDDGCFDLLVEEDGNELLISHDDGSGDVVWSAVSYVAECARRFILPGTWSATYSGGAVAMDLADQIPVYIGSEEIVAVAKRKLEEVMAQKVTFPFKIAMPQDMPDPTEWLQENVGDERGYYTRAVIDNDGCAVDEEVFLFKSESAAVHFKLRFGGPEQQ